MTLANPTPLQPMPRALRTVRSFVRRQGRMTEAQRRALQLHWPKYGIDHQAGLLDLDVVFGHQAPRVIEIGFGNGEALFAMARDNPAQDYLGIEVHRPGVGSLLQRLDDHGIENVRVINDDAIQVLEHIPAATIDAVHLYFPDPWPKKRHHKRRIVQPGFVALIGSKLKAGGVFHMATDWEAYALHMMAVMADQALFENLAGEQRFSPRPEWRPQTRFEQRGQRLGHQVWDLIFRRRA